MGWLADRTWRRLPEAWRHDDAQLGYQLQRWLEGALDPVEAGATQVRALATGEGTDPLLAPEEWLDWLAARTGVSLLDGGGPFREQFAHDAQRKPGTRAAIRRHVHAYVGHEPILDVRPWLTVIDVWVPDVPVAGHPIVTWRDLRTVCPTPAHLIAEGTVADTAAIDYGRVLVATAAEPIRPACVRFASGRMTAEAVETDPFEIIELTPGNLIVSALTVGAS